jgi:hypothetical protein
MRLGFLTFPPSLNRLEAGLRTNVTVALSTVCGSMPRYDGKPLCREFN